MEAGWNENVKKNMMRGKCQECNVMGSTVLRREALRVQGSAKPSVWLQSDW